MSGRTLNVDAAYERAIQCHQAGQLGEAEQLYREILAADPRQLDCLHLLGVLAQQRGDYDGAVELIGRAIATNDRIAAYHASIAEAHRLRGDGDAAVAHYTKAVQLEPAYWEAHHQLAALLLAGGQAETAIAPARNALAIKETDEAKTLLVRSLTQAMALPNDTDFHRLIYRALTERWVRPAELAQVAAATVKQNRLIAEAAAGALAAWPRRLTAQEIAPAMGAIAGDPVLNALMMATPVPDLGLERLLTSVRAVLLEAATEATTDIAEAMLPFCCALARQCHINEYVFAAAAPERATADRLRAGVANALKADTPLLALRVIALASYLPLSSIPDAEALLRRRWPDAVAAVIAQQLA